MPKLKTNKSAVKRFKKTRSGKYKHRGSCKNHILTKKASKRKSRLSGMHMVSKRDHKAVRRMLNN